MEQNKYGMALYGPELNDGAMLDSTVRRNARCIYDTTHGTVQYNTTQ